jgi:hypothetical protein
VRSFLVAMTLGCALSLTLPALGRVVVPVDPDRKVEAVKLRVDRSSSRAWVEVTLARRFLSGKEVRYRHNVAAIAVAVPELSFDRATGEIKLVSGEGAVTCAVLEEEEIKETGACRIDAKIEALDVDTGFGVTRRDHLVVSMTPR